MADRIRILFVDHETRLGGGQQDLADLVRALDPALFEVHAALPGEGPLADALRAGGAAVHHLPIAARLRRVSRWSLARRPWIVLARAGSFATAALRLGRLVRRLDPAIVHTNSMKAHLLAMVPARLLRVPLVWHVRDVLEPGGLRTAFAALGGRFPRRIACLSRIAADQFRDTAAGSKVRVVYNGIHLDRFRATPGDDLRRRFGVPRHGVLVGMVGQLAWWKGQDVFVEAAAKVLASHPDARFLVVGECLFPENEASFAASLRDRAAELGLADRVIFTGWTDHVEEVVGAIDVLVHASRLPEPFGRVIVEGMAAGKPVVASTAGAGPEILAPDAGRLVAPGDPASLADAIIALAGDAEERRRCGTAGRIAARRFDISETALGVMSLYAEALA